MKIAVVASEAAPFVKTGGLGDVMQALPLALSQQKNTYVSLFIPYYSQIKYSGKWQTEFLGAFDVPLAWRREYVGIFRLKTRRKKLQIYFIDNEHYFNRGGVYGFADDGERYAYFSKALSGASAGRRQLPRLAGSAHPAAAENGIPRLLPGCEERVYDPQYRISGQVQSAIQL